MTVLQAILDRGGPWQQARITGPEWTEARRRIDRMAHDLGPEAVAWVERQDQGERATG